MKKRKRKVTLAEVFGGLYAELDSTKSDLEKFDNGNKSAGVRVRKHMQNIKGAAQQIREMIVAK